MSYLIDGWMTCDFTSFSTIFQSYQDDGRLIMKGCMHWNFVYGREDLAPRGDRFVVFALLFYVHGKHLRSCRDGQLT